MLILQDALAPLPVSEPLILAVSSVLLALHHKMTAILPTHCLKTKTKSDIRYRIYSNFCLQSPHIFKNQ